MMQIILNPNSPKPIYMQIVEAFKKMIIEGELKENDSLPSIRGLAKDLHISIITTQRAYDELVKDGFIYVVQAKGAFVAKISSEFILEENRLKIENLLKEVIDLARNSGITLNELKQVIDNLGEKL